MVRVLAPKNPWTYDYDSDPLDGDILNLTYADPAPAALADSTPRLIFCGGGRVSPVNMPTKIRLNGRKRKLLDVDNQFHLFMVSQRFLDIVQNLQSEIQYFPVDCYWTDGSLAGQRFFFFTTLLLDAVDREKTTIPWFMRSNGFGMWDDSGPEGRGKKLVFSKAALADHHIWVDPHCPTMGPFISEALYSELKHNKIEHFYDCPSLDEA